MTPEIGDKFIINWDGIKKNYPNVQKCLYPDKEFTIDHFSKTEKSVYFDNVIENWSCYCQVCKDGSRSVGVSDIIITKKRVAIDREKKLNELGI